MTLAAAAARALHDQTCPEGAECRDRDLHAASSLHAWFDGPRFLRDLLADPAARNEVAEQLWGADAPHEEWRWRNPNSAGVYGTSGYGVPQRDRATVQLFDDDTLQRRLTTEWKDVPR